MNAYAMRGGAGPAARSTSASAVSSPTSAGGLSSLGGAIAGSVVNPLISTAQGAAHRAANATPSAGIFRDMPTGPSTCSATR
jgi:hypothetical protein